MVGFRAVRQSAFNRRGRRVSRRDRGESKNGKSAEALFPRFQEGENSIGALLNLGPQRRRLGLVHAERFRIQIIAGRGKGARATSHANVAELAAAALPF